MGRMIDYCVGLKLSEDEKDIVTGAFRSLPYQQNTLNQTLSYIHSPLFIDIEMKKRNQLRPPEVRLSIWACAALRKRQQHGWNTELPMPAITIEGHTWTYFLSFERDGELVSFLLGLTGYC